MSGEVLSYNRPTSPQSSLSQPIVDSLGTDGGIVHSWCNSGSCWCHPVPVPQVWCSDVPIMCRCCYTWSATARMIRCLSCLNVVLRWLTVRTLQFIALASSAVLMPLCNMPKAHSRRWAGTLGIFLLVFFSVSRNASLVTWVFITVTLIAYRLSAVSVLTTVPQVHVHSLFMVHWMGNSMGNSV